MDRRLDELADHLRATGERPVERTANRWLGEAEAIAVDLAEHDLDPATRRERLSKVDDLLSNVDTTGDDRADDHVATAREIVGQLRGRS